MKDKKNFVSQIERQLESWNSELIKFRIIAEVADPDSQIEHYHVIEEIVEKEHRVRDKLDDIKASPDNSKGSVEEIMELWKEIDDIIDYARIQIN